MINWIHRFRIEVSIPMSNRTFTWIVLGLLTVSLLGSIVLIDAALDILNGLDSGLLRATNLDGVEMFRHLVETQLLLPILMLMGFTVFGIVLLLYIRQMHQNALEQGRAASANLHIQEGYLRALFDNANALMYIKDLEGRCLRVNQGYEQLFGVPAETLIGKTVFDMFPQSVAEAIAKANHQAIASGQNVVTEHHVLLPNGLHTLLMNQFPIRDANGRIYALGGIGTDVSTVRQIEEDLRIRDQAIEASTSAILILDAQQPELPTIYVNPAFETITGYSRAEALGRNPLYLYGDDLDQPGLTSLREAIRRGQDCKVLLRNYRKSGEMYWNELSISPIRDPNGRLTHYVGIQNDVTSRIEAVQELHDNWEFISMVMKLIPDGVYVFDIQHFVNIYNNQAFERLLGYSFNEILAMGPDIVNIILDPEDLPRVMDQIQQYAALQDGETLHVERRLRHKDGEFRWIECHETIIERSADGLPRRILGIAIDVTERRRVEAELRKSQAMVEHITRLIPDGILLHNLNQEYLYDNNRFAEMLGYSPEEMRAIGNRLERIAHLAHPDDLATIDYGSRIQNLIDGHELQTALRMRHKDGSWRWLSFREVLVSRLEDGTPDQILSLATDITERKQAEMKLSASTRMLERITQTIPDFIYIHDVVNQQVAFQNEGFYRLLGYTPEDIPESTLGLVFSVVHPDDVPLLVESVMRLPTMADGEICETTYRIQHKNGDWRWWYVRESIFNRSDDGSPVQVVGIAQDITVQKAAEAALIESKRLVDQVANLIPECLYILDLFDMNIIYQNDGYARILGYPVEVLRGSWQVILDIVHPDDVGLLADNVARLHQAPPQHIVESEYRVRHSNGQWRWLNAREIVLTRDEDGQPRQILGSATDITERKEAVEKLRQREERYRVISEVSSDYAYFHKVNPDGSIERQWITEGFERVLGLEDQPDPETVLNGRAYFEQQILHPDDQAVRETDLRRVVAGERVYSEYRIIVRGEIRWLGVYRKPEIDPKTGQVTGYYGVVQDITDRKRAEEALRASEDRYRRLFASSPQPMWVYDLETLAFLDVNEAAVQQYGYTRDEFLSMTLRDLGPTEEGKVLVPTVDHNDPPNAWRHRKKDGSLIDVEVASHELIYEGHRAQMSLVHDITARLQAERARQQSEQRYRDLWAASQRQAQELSLIAQVRNVTASELDLKHLVSKVVEAVAETFGYTLVSLYLRDEDVLHLVHQIGYNHSSPDKIIEELPTTQGVLGRVARTGQPTFLKDVTADPDFIDVIDGVASEICVPLIDQGEVVGVFNVETTYASGLTDDDFRIVSILGKYISIAIGRARLYTDLRNSEQRFREITETISQMFWVYDVQQLRFVYVSPASEIIWKLSSEEIYNHPERMYNSLYPDDVTRFKTSLAQLFQTNEPQQTEFRILWPDGTVRWLAVQMYPAGDSVDPQQRVIGLMEDITARKQIEQAEHEQRMLAESFREIAETLSRTLDLDEVLDLIMETMERVVPSDAASLMLEERGKVRVVRDRGFNEVTQAYLKSHTFDVQDIPNFVRMRETHDWMIIDDVLVSRDWTTFEVPLPVRSYLGVPIIVEDQVVGVINVDSQIVGFFTPEHAEKMKTFAAQAAIAIQNARLYKQAQELATIEERQRLARELHDAVSQTLFSASVIAETLPRIYERQSREQVQRGLLELNRLTRGAMAEMRTLLAELRPRALLDGDLPTLVKQLADAAAGHVQAQFTVELPPQCVLPAEVKLVFYRIAQEGLNNIIKHARPRKVDVRMSRTNDGVWLEITDDGRGFDPDRLVSGHYGLQIMRERAAAVGAHFAMDSQPGQGTRLHLHWREREQVTEAT